MIIVKNLPPVILICMLSLSISAQTNKTFFLGHSLVNFDMPNMVDKLSQAGSKQFTYHANIGIGAPLIYHWDNPTSGQGSHWKTTLPQGGFEHMIITEAVPLLNHTTWSNTYRIVDSLYRFARMQNPNMKYYIYETWHCTTTGTPSGCDWDNDDALAWRPRLTADLPKWETIADSLNAIHPNSMLVIPAGQAMARLADQITLGNVPGFTSIFQLFSDDIHLTDIGNYFVACVMYSVIHKTSPVGLPNNLTNQWGGSYTAIPTVAQAQALQQIAWNTVCDYARNGVTCSPTLPVYNLGFSADAYNNNYVEILWHTDSELNNDYFEIERSPDAINWQNIHTTTGAGTKNTRTQYRVIDDKPQTGYNYYRIKQVDTDGKYSYSSIVKAYIYSSQPFALYPNPTQGALVLEGASLEDVKVYSLEGREVTQHAEIKHSGTNLTVALEGLSNGIYIIKARGESRRFVLQR